LPQLAAYGDTHFQVAKHVAGDRTLTAVQDLSGEPRIVELARMMGADSQAGRASVQEIMMEVASTKGAAQMEVR
jgi:DNA repair protein RecN (Recombination protein N)